MLIRMDKRKGADVDGKNMQELLEKLGFKVRMEVDHTAAVCYLFTVEIS